MTRASLRGAARVVICAVITSAALLVMALPDIIVNLIFGQYA